MRVFVTGASGFIGRHLVAALSDTHQVFAAVRRRPLYATAASDLPLPGPEAPVATVATNMPANR